MAFHHTDQTDFVVVGVAGSKELVVVAPESYSLHVELDLTCELVVVACL